MPSDKRIDWNAVKAEFMSGASYGILANHYGVNKSAIYRKAQKEEWAKQRERTVNAVETATIKKKAAAAADNAIKAERIKSKLLDILERQIDELPQKIGSASYISRFEDKKDKKTGKTYKEKSGIEFKLRDLAAVYKDLTADMPQVNAEETSDDGFLAALSGKAAEIWADGDDNEQEDSDV